METEVEKVEVQKTEDEKKEVKKRGRKNMPFATMCASECVAIPEGIWKYASGEKIRRITLFDQLGKSPDSGPSRTMVTASSKYGFTNGGYQAEYLELSNEGYVAFNPDEQVDKRLQAKFNLVIQGNEFFSSLYEKYKGAKLPIKSVIMDCLGENGLEEDLRETGAELFVENLKYLGLIKVLSGAERIISIEQALEEIKGLEKIPKTSQADLKTNSTAEEITGGSSGLDFEKICFYIAPIGEEGSEERQHSDLFLESIVTPAIEGFDYKVIRADNISKPGMITNQIIDYIMKAGLVVCDLSFHNPNVFYELSLRHATKKPTIHIIRKSDSIPFDINDFRTIIIDDTSIYTLVPSMESYKNQIAQQVRQMLDNPDAIDNPISSYLEKNKINHL
ncbi:MAG: hypothetical protein ACI4HQ_11065 [Acetatifactor sp.]